MTTDEQWVLGVATMQSDRNLKRIYEQQLERGPGEHVLMIPGEHREVDRGLLLRVLRGELNRRLTVKGKLSPLPEWAEETA